MFENLYPVTYRLAKAHMESHRQREATAPAPADDVTPAAVRADAARVVPLRLTIELPTEGVSGIAIRLLRSGRSLTATLDLEEGSQPQSKLEGSP